MVSAIVIIFYSIVLIAVSFFYLKARYHLLENKDIGSVIKKNFLYIILTCAVFVMMAGAQISYVLRHDVYAVPVLLKWSTLFWGAYLLAKVDFHEKKIPNKIVLVLLLLRIAFLVYEIFINLEYWKTVIGYPILGALIGGAIMFVAMVVSRMGVGMGDVKMFIVIGAFVGSSEIISTLFYTVLISAIWGIGMMIFRKASLKDSLPLAPFACVGIALEYLMLMIGG